jgi:hypothetical protein
MYFIASRAYFMPATGRYTSKKSASIHTEHPSSRISKLSIQLIQNCQPARHIAALRSHRKARSRVLLHQRHRRQLLHQLIGTQAPRTRKLLQACVQRIRQSNLHLSHSQTPCNFIWKYYRFNSTPRIFYAGEEQISLINPP